MNTELDAKIIYGQSSMEIVPMKKGIYFRYIKRPLDFILSLIALIVLSPVILVVAVFVRVNLGSPILFKQARPGKNEKIFTVYKFRTMTDKKDKNGNLLPDEERLTKFGRILRSTSQDELLQLLNILKGEMAIVGPRPLCIEYLPFYNEFEKRRHEVAPGLTGAAQINGRNAISWEQKFIYDVQYANNITFLGDVKVVLGTIKAVLKRSGIGQAEEAPESLDVLRKRQLKEISEETDR